MVNLLIFNRLFDCELWVIMGVISQYKTSQKYSQANHR